MNGSCRKATHTFGAAMVAALFALTSAPVRSMDFAEFFSLAKSHDPGIRVARLEAQAVGFGRAEAKAALLPSLLLTAGYTQTDQEILSSQNSVYRAAPKVTYPGQNYGLTISQPIFRLAAWRNLEQANEAIQQAALTLASAEQELIVRSASAYLAALAARDALDLVIAESRAIEAQLVLVREKHGSGLVSSVALNEVTGRHEVKRAEVLAAQTELSDRIAALQEIAGALPPDSISQLRPLRTDAQLPDPDPSDESVWRDSAARQNPGVLAKEAFIRVQQAEVLKKRAGYFPTLDLVVGSNQRRTDGSLFGGGSEVRTTEASVNLTVPLFEGGITNAQVDAASRRLLAARDDAERVRRSVDRQTSTVYRAVISGKAKVSAYEQSVAAFEAARRLREVALRSGISGVIPLLDAERDLFRARRELAQSRYDLLINALRLRQLAGSLDESDVEKVATLTR